MGKKVLQLVRTLPAWRGYIPQEPIIYSIISGLIPHQDSLWPAFGEQHMQQCKWMCQVDIFTPQYHGGVTTQPHGDCHMWCFVPHPHEERKATLHITCNGRDGKDVASNIGVVWLTFLPTNQNAEIWYRSGCFQ